MVAITTLSSGLTCGIVGAGYDQVDVHACTAKDIRVSNVPTAVDDATADTNMFALPGLMTETHIDIFQVPHPWGTSRL